MKIFIKKFTSFFLFFAIEIKTVENIHIEDLNTNFSMSNVNIQNIHMRLPTEPSINIGFNRNIKEKKTTREKFFDFLKETKYCFCFYAFILFALFLTSITTFVLNIQKYCNTFKSTKILSEFFPISVFINTFLFFIYYFFILYTKYSLKNLVINKNKHTKTELILYLLCFLYKISTVTTFISILLYIDNHPLLSNLYVIPWFVFYITKIIELFLIVLPCCYLM